MSGTVWFARAPHRDVGAWVEASHQGLDLQFSERDAGRVRPQPVAARASSESQPAWSPPPVSTGTWAALLASRVDVSGDPVTTATALDAAVEIGRVAARASSESQPAWSPPPVSAGTWAALLASRADVSGDPVTTATALDAAVEMGRAHD